MIKRNKRLRSRNTVRDNKSQARKLPEKVFTPKQLRSIVEDEENAESVRESLGQMAEALEVRFNCALSFFVIRLYTRRLKLY